MYHKDQEEIVFGIVLILVALFQIVSFVVIFFISIKLSYCLILIGINIISFFGMVKYVQWLWKESDFFGAIKKTIKYELILASIAAGLYFLIKYKILV